MTRDDGGRRMNGCAQRALFISHLEEKDRLLSHFLAGPQEVYMYPLLRLTEDASDELSGVTLTPPGSRGAPENLNFESLRIFAVPTIPGATTLA